MSAGRGYTNTTVSEAAAALGGLPTFKNVCKHVDRYGLDGSQMKRYSAPTTYKAFAQDAAVRTAFSHFSEDAYVQFVERYGMHGWAEDARADYQKERGES